MKITKRESQRKVPHSEKEQGPECETPEQAFEEEFNFSLPKVEKSAARKSQ
jgi:hypothetical protein